MSAHYPDYAPEILALLKERDALPTDIAILQPADPFLDMAGEELRRRIFLTESETGETLCLRPEFTIPVCRDHIAKRAATPCRYGYLGEVFRQGRSGGSEFFQAGIEDLGSTDRALADARSLADAYDMLSRVLPNEELAASTGDQAIFEAILTELDLPAAWRKRLSRLFGSAALLDAALSEFANPSGNGTLPSGVSELIASGDAEALQLHIETDMRRMGFSPAAGRHPKDIAKRLMEKEQLAATRIPASALATLKSFLALNAPLGKATEHLSRFANEHQLDIEPAIVQFSERLRHIAQCGLPMDRITYDAGFGRPLDYYTGFIFEIGSPKLSSPLAGGGRYDRMLTLLGAREPIPGVGFSIWLDRVDSLRRITA